jgi:hypothetical protein
MPFHHISVLFVFKKTDHLSCKQLQKNNFLWSFVMMCFIVNNFGIFHLQCHQVVRKQLRWPRGSVLPLSTQDCGFKPGRSCQDFQGRKILSTPSHVIDLQHVIDP